MAAQTFQHMAIRENISNSPNHIGNSEHGVAACREQMRMCLVVVTFWPGVPLHYAGRGWGSFFPGVDEGERSIGVWSTPPKTNISPEKCWLVGRLFSS